MPGSSTVSGPGLGITIYSDQLKHIPHLFTRTLNRDTTQHACRRGPRLIPRYWNNGVGRGSKDHLPAFNLTIAIFRICLLRGNFKN